MKMRKKIPVSQLPVWPAVFSGILAPGTGQIMNGEFLKGIFLLTASLGSGFWFSKIVTEQVSLLTSVPPEKWQQDPTPLINALTKVTENNPGMFLTFYLLVALVWGYSVVDAYLTARELLKKRLSPLLPPPPESDEDSHPVR